MPGGVDSLGGGLWLPAGVPARCGTHLAGGFSSKTEVMKQILVYADSLSWGIVPGTRQRQPFDRRWPGVLENRLNRPDSRVRIIEDCLNGRRTVWDDPFKPGRNGSKSTRRWRW